MQTIHSKHRWITQIHGGWLDRYAVNPPPYAPPIPPRPEVPNVRPAPPYSPPVPPRPEIGPPPYTVFPPILPPRPTFGPPPPYSP